MTRGRKWGFACGQLGAAVMARFFFSWSMKFADQRDAAGEALFDVAIVGGILLAVRVLDALSGPLFGVWSERWVRSGRERRSLLLLGALPASLGFLLVFGAGGVAAPELRWAMLAVGMCVFFLGESSYGVPYLSSLDDLAGEDEEARRGLSGVLGFIGFIVIALVALASPRLVGAQGYWVAALVFGLPPVLLKLVPYWVGRGGGAPRRLPRVEETIRVGKDVPRCLRQRPFLAVVLAFGGVIMAASVMTLAAPFIAERLLGGTEKDVSRLMAPFLATSLPFFGIAPSLTRRWGWRPVMIAALAGLSLVYLSTAFLGQAWFGSPMGTAMVMFGAAGPFLAVLLSIQAHAITDVARASGDGMIGVYVGVCTFLMKILHGVGVFCMSLLVRLSRQPGWEIAAVRGMPVLAASLLAVGISGYLLLSRRAPH